MTEAEKWREMAHEAALRACDECREYVSGERPNCKVCRVQEILDEAERDVQQDARRRDEA